VTTVYNRLEARTPPAVPEDPKQELAWLEWMDIGDDALHPLYHRAGGDSPYNPDHDAVLTTRGKAAELAGRPCPTCYQEDEQR